MSDLWPHPDFAFSPWYRAPDGLVAEACRHSPSRMGVGPYPGKVGIGFTADVCRNCGRVMRSVRDIDWQSYFWARRFNAQINPLPTGERDE